MKYRCVLIGSGKLGSALSEGFAKGDAVEMVGVVAHRESAKALASALRCDLLAPDAPWPEFDWLLIATSDAQIGHSAQALSAHQNLAAKVVCHCSGALNHQVLEPLAAQGAYCASVHPMYSFAAGVAVDLAGVYCAMQGDPRAMPLLESCFGSLGARCFLLKTEDKSRYHAAACIASNAQFALADVAMNLLAASGVPADMAREMFAQIASNSVANIAKLGPTQAITGPVSRGDVATLKGHFDALHSVDPAAVALYQQLCLRLMALSSSKLDAAKYQALNDLLQDP